MKKNVSEKEILENALNEIVKTLKTKSIKLSNSMGDGRLNSAKNENEIIDVILEFIPDLEYFKKNNLKIGTPNLISNNNREWYDFAIESKDTSIHNYFMPINIKVSELDNAADNLSCKLGIFYALTGCLPKSVSLGNGGSWETFFKKTDENMAKNKDKDYYFLVVNKKDTSEVFWNSLKSLKTLTPNGNNLPFQCKWCDNKIRTERNYEEARKFILECFEKSIRLRENIGVSFDKYLKKYLITKEENK